MKGWKAKLEKAQADAAAAKARVSKNAREKLDASEAAMAAGVIAGAAGSGALRGMDLGDVGGIPIDAGAGVALMGVAQTLPKGSSKRAAVFGAGLGLVSNYVSELSETATRTYGGV